MENYTLKEWLENHDDVSLYDNVYLFDISDVYIDFEEYDKETQEEILNSEVISEEVTEEEYFKTYELKLDILKGWC